MELMMKKDADTALPKGYKQTEVGVIPEDWVVKTLGDVGDVQMCKRIFTYQTTKRGDVPFYKIGTFGKEPDAYIHWDLYQEFRKKYSFPKKGYLLISASGTIGRTVEYMGEDAYYQDSNIIWIDNDEKLISNKYLNYTLKVIKYNTEGSTIKRLYNSIIKSSKFVIPPTLTEQKAIATALSDVDALISSLDQLISKKKAIKQGAMQELLTGKTRLQGFAGSGRFKQTEVGVIPEEWGIHKQKDAVKYINGRAYSIHEWESTGVPVVRLQNLTQKGGNFYYSNLSLPAHQYMHKGDLIFMWSASFGPYIWWGDKAIFHYHIWKIECNKNITDKDFYYHKLVQLTSELKKGTSGSTMLHLTKDGMEKYLFALPPTLTEQKAIATVLSDMDKDIALLESKKAKYQHIKQGMMQELLTGKTRLV